eukprot:499608-Pyramimonas_sp.AAC.1
MLRSRHKAPLALTSQNGYGVEGARGEGGIALAAPRDAEHTRDITVASHGVGHRFWMGHWATDRPFRGGAILASAWRGLLNSARLSTHTGVASTTLLDWQPHIGHHIGETTRTRDITGVKTADRHASHDAAIATTDSRHAKVRTSSWRLERSVQTPLSASNICIPSPGDPERLDSFISYNAHVRDRCGRFEQLFEPPRGG